MRDSESPARQKKRLLEGALLVVFALLCLACNKLGPPLRCESHPDGVGAWTYPWDFTGGMVIGGPLSDGAQLMVFPLIGGPLGSQLGVWDPSLRIWSTQPLTGVDELSVDPVGDLRAAPGYVLSWGLHEVTPSDAPNGTLYVWSKKIALLDRANAHWSEFEPPVAFRRRYMADGFWTGSEFLVWGGQMADERVEERGYEPDSVVRNLYDGVFFNPVEKTWRMMPPMRPDSEHVFKDDEHQDLVKGVWTDAGFFVWGLDADAKKPYGALYLANEDRWTELETKGGPPGRTWSHQLVADGDDVYLFNGETKGGRGPYRDLWRYSLSKESWTEIDVPRAADLQMGAMVEGRLVFAGYCPSSMLYQPTRDEWEFISSEGTPNYEQLGHSSHLAVAGASLAFSVTGRHLSPEQMVLLELE